MTLKNSRVGNVVDEKGAMLGGSSDTAPTNLVIDNVVFHDVRQVGAGVHNECIFSAGAGADYPQLDLHELRDDGSVHRAWRLVGAAAVWGS